MKEKAKKLIEKYEELESELGNPDVLGDQARYNKIHKQYKGIEKAVLKAKEYLQMMDDLDEYKASAIPTQKWSRWQKRKFRKSKRNSPK